MLSVVIVNYNTRAYLHECLTSLQHTGYPVEVFVVDNGSTDGSAAMLREQFQWVNLIASDQNLGFAAANNVALRRCIGEYLMLLNPDTLVCEGALETLVQFLDRNLGVGVVAPRLLNSDGTLQPSCREFPTPRTVAMRLTLFGRLAGDKAVNDYLMADWAHDAQRDVDQPMGACLVVRRQVMEQVGNLDERFFMYFEEVDWCFRIKRAGWRIMFLPTAEVVHYGRGAVNQYLNQMNFEYHRSMMKYFHKHKSAFSIGSRYAMHAAFAVHAGLLAVVCGLLGVFQRELRSKALRATRVFVEAIATL